MTRKDYVALANALGDALSVEGEGTSDFGAGVAHGLRLAVDAISDALKADNAAFRREQFTAAVAYRAATGKLVKVGQTRFDR